MKHRNEREKMKRKKRVLIITVLAACYVVGGVLAIGIRSAYEEAVEKSRMEEALKKKSDGAVTSGKKGTGKPENESGQAVDAGTTQQEAYTFDDLNQEMYASVQVNYRTGPSASFEKKGTVSRGSRVMVNGQCRETKWYRVTGFGDDPVYISNEYLTDQKPEQPSQTSSGTEGTAQASSQGDWVQSLRIAQSLNQLIVVSTSGSRATVSMHNKNADGTWTEILSTSGFIGRNGLGKTREGDRKTPVGVYGFTSAFGIRPDPGCSLGYTQVDDSYYWVDDPSSSHYNRMVSTNTMPADWNSAEHITAVGQPYDYVLALNYNAACTPGAGSAVFLHCSNGNATAGCVSVPEDVMIRIMQNVRPGCNILIDSADGVKRY